MMVDQVKNILGDVMQSSEESKDTHLSDEHRAMATFEKHRWDQKLRSSSIPTRYQNSTFMEIEKRGIPAEIRQSFEAAKKYAEEFEERKREGIGLLLCGSSGRLKTTFAAAVALYVMKELDAYSYFVSIPELLSTMNTMAKRNERESIAKIEDKIKSTELLILDDFGAEYAAPWLMAEVDMMISYRYNKMLPTIITTNLSPGEIAERYAYRIFDRLRSTSLLIVEDGPSLRPTAK